MGACRRSIAFCVRHCRLQNHLVTVCAPPAAPNAMAPKVAAGARKKVDRRDPYRKLSSEDIRLAQLWHAEDDMEPSEIASLLRRDKSIMTRLMYYSY